MARRRIGVVGDMATPVAQLLQDLPRMAGADFVAVSDPAGDSIALDELLVLSHLVALAHLPALAASATPCTLILRRAGAPEDAELWRSGMVWLGQSLAGIDWPGLTLAALTDAAASELSALIGRPVEPLGPLPRIATERPSVSVYRDADEITFSLDTGGTRETRHAAIAMFNWARLRRLARLRPGSATDPDLADLTGFANGAAAPLAAASADGPPCVLAVVPNGVGLGHVTRMLAIATALKREHGVRVVFWSFSRAAEILQAAGFEVILRQTAMHLQAHPPSWRRWETLEFAKAIRSLRPSVVSYDGMTFDHFIMDALLEPGCGQTGIVWVRRGMLRPETDAGLLESEQFCDLVVEPGDLAVEWDRGPTRTRQARNRGFSRRVDARPVTLKPYLPSYSRAEARRKLGLGWGRYCLVSLGGAFGDWDLLRDRIRQSAAHRRVKLIWARSPLAAPEFDETTEATRQFYPLNRYLLAFDGMITAAGYNSYHELMLGYDGPILLAPTNFQRLDDQVARAEYAGRKGWAAVVHADRPDEQAPIIDGFFAAVRRREANTARPRARFGGSDVAAAIVEIIRRYRPESAP